MSSFRRFSSRYCLNNVLYSDYAGVTVYRGDAEILRLRSDVRQMPEDALRLGYIEKYLIDVGSRSMWTTDRENARYYANFDQGTEMTELQYAEGNGWIITSVIEALASEDSLEPNPDRASDEQGEEYVVYAAVPQKCEFSLSYIEGGEEVYVKEYTATYDAVSQQWDISS